MEFFCTFGGNPVSCAIGMAVLDEIEDRDLMGRARELGGRFIEGLRELQVRHPIIGDVRGRGLFLGFEMVRNQETLEPAADEAQALVDFMRDRGVLMSTDGPLHNVIKIKPPMVLNGEDVEITLKLLDEGLASL
jgi:4-aminobutyrate aminotransferase-like enzyme